MIQQQKVLSIRRQISRSEWTDYVNSALDLEEAEAILSGMRQRFLTKRKLILRKLAQGATIENDGAGLEPRQLAPLFHSSGAVLGVALLPEVFWN